LSIAEKLKKYDIDVSGKKLTVLDFYTDWCPPCQEIKPILERKEKDGHIILKSINLDENLEIEDLFKIEAVPTLIFFKNREIVDFNLHLEDEDGEIHKIVKNGIIVGFYGEEILDLIINAIEKNQKRLMI